MNWQRGGKYWIECESHTISKIVVTARGPVGGTKIPRVFYEVWRKAPHGGRPVRLEGHYASADEAKAAAERDAQEATC